MGLLAKLVIGWFGVSGLAIVGAWVGGAVSDIGVALLLMDVTVIWFATPAGQAVWASRGGGRRGATPAAGVFASDAAADEALLRRWMDYRKVDS